MALSKYTLRSIFIAAIPIGAAVLSLLIPAEESFKVIKTDRPWAKTFRESLFEVSANDARQTDFLSKNLCKGIQSELKSGAKLSDGIKQIDSAMTQIGAHISQIPAYINKGYITYTFKREADNDLPQAELYEKTLNTFAGQSVGPTYTWLNPRWYQEHRTANLESVGRKFIKNDDPYITIKFETPFPLLDEYTKNGLLNNPPKHIAKPADYDGLDLAKSERRDVFEYTYAIDMRQWYQKVSDGDLYYNINFQVSARRNKDGSLDDLQTNVTCKYPSKGVLFTAPGTPPATDETLSIRPPITIPSCPEYLKWFLCQSDPGRAECGKNENAVPSCPADAPDFPRADYPLVP